MIEKKENNENNFKKLRDEIKQKGEFKGKGADSDVYFYNGKIYKIYENLSLEELKYYSNLQLEFYKFLKKYFKGAITTIFPNGGNNLIGDENSSISCLEFIDGESFDIEDFHTMDERFDAIVEKLKDKNDSISKWLYELLYNCSTSKEFFSRIFGVFLITYNPQFGEKIKNNIGFSNVKYNNGKFVITDCSDNIKLLIKQVKIADEQFVQSLRKINK